MRKVKLELRKTVDQSYDILIEPGLLQRAAETVVQRFGRTAVAVVTDTNVAERYAEPLAGRLAAAGCRQVEVIAIPAGEASKTREIKGEVEDSLFASGLGRDSLVLALGGGVVGDLAGFVAATYARGVMFVQAPTTLLSMLDSSVGGKTGVDVPWGKNMVGAFHQPSLVLIDPAVLDSLPAEQFSSGMAEAVKHGVILDGSLFEFIEAKKDAILALEPETLSTLIERNCAIKAAVVSEDEREGNLRQILNFGHTLGHAVEALSGFKLLHGQAVAVGMVLEAELSADLGLLPESDVARLEGLLAALGLPVRVDLPGVSALRILEHTRLDKKARSGQARYVLPARIGAMTTDPQGRYGLEVEDPLVLKVLRRRGAR
ncbi:3-dehydroquinate synthase [bacterium]|nr:3-dehydroquinate synthase [bacterium]